MYLREKDDDYGYGGYNQQDDYDDYDGMGYDDEDRNEEKGFEKRIQGDDDIFVFKKVELPNVHKNEEIKKYIISEETKILITKSNRIYRWRTSKEPDFKLYDLPDLNKDHFLGFLAQKERTVNIKNVYLDPKGYHCIIVSEAGNNFYLNYREEKVRLLPKLKAVNIKALAFHSSGTQSKSGIILFSTENAIISLYRLEIASQELLEHLEPSVLQLQTTLDITNISILKLEQSTGPHVIIILSNISSLYCITGGHDIELLLKKFKDPNQKVLQVPMPRGYQTLGHACISKISGRPTSIIWTNGIQILLIKIPDYNEKLKDSFLFKNESLRFAKKVDLPIEKAYQITDHPTAIGITDFHYYILFQECLTIISTVTQKIVHCEEFRGVLMSDMQYDPNMGCFWLYDQKGVLKLDTSRELAETEKLLISEKKYKEAYEVCKAKKSNLSYAAGQYGDDLFKKKKYEKAAVLYSQTSRTFEEIFLKFLQANSPDAREGLTIYLFSWLNKLTPDQKTQRCLLISYIIELIVYELNNLQRQKGNSQGQRNVDIKAKLKQKQSDLEKLLDSNLDVINENLVYLIMQSHGRIQNLINFADKKNNFEMIIIHYLSEESYDKALEYLKNVKDPKVVEVVYKYSHIFFRYEPEKTVNLLIRTIKDFKPIKLMPGLMNIPDKKRVHGIDLLRYCVEDLKSREKSLHNILIFFYSSSKEKLSELIDLMKKGRLDFDLDFGLRLFKNYNIIEAQIIVYGKMYLYSEAVKLALENSKEELAKEYAKRPEGEDERKKLWIEIAKYYLVKKGKISEVIELTKQSKVIKIEDLLPYFNQNIKIENFKDEICESLKSYSEDITKLKVLMDSYSTNADQLKNELRVIKNRCIEIDSSHKCEECFKTLFNQEFYIFPCMHGFHRDCLYESIKNQPTLDPILVEKISVLNEEIRGLRERIARKREDQRFKKDRESGSGFSFMNLWNGPKKESEDVGFTSNERQEEELRVKKDEVDSILAAECVYCGPRIVDTITMSFNNEQLKESWKI